jgi:hypothetical protein
MFTKPRGIRSAFAIMPPGINERDTEFLSRMGEKFDRRFRNYTEFVGWAMRQDRQVIDLALMEADLVTREYATK